MYQMTLQDHDYKVSETTLPLEVFGYRWLYHPDSRVLQRHYKLLLESLCLDGDLTEVGYLYQLAPRALTTLAVHEEEDRRHKDNVKLQRALVFLTLMLIFVEFMPETWNWETIWDWVKQEALTQTN
jgi:hypothetical protein